MQFKKSIRFEEVIVKDNKNIFRLPSKQKCHESSKEHHTQLIEYDVRMRQEEKKYSRLLAELTQTRWMHLSDMQGSDKHNLLAVYHDDAQTKDKCQPSELDVTRLTGEEILHGCGLTMEQVVHEHQKSPLLLPDGIIEGTSTQDSISFQYTLSLQHRNISHSPLIGMQTECNTKEERCIIVYSLLQEKKKEH
jgi:hypothetical protein